eukprot:1346080-Amorphochlora_amoeboformis.AAC.2
MEYPLSSLARAGFRGTCFPMETAVIIKRGIKRNRQRTASNLVGTWRTRSVEDEERTSGA